MLESLLVPSYSEAVQTPPPSNLSQLPTYNRRIGLEVCACGRSNETLNNERERLREGMERRNRNANATAIGGNVGRGQAMMDMVRRKEEYRPVPAESATSGASQ